MKIWKPVWSELSRPSDVVSKFMNFYKICFLSWHRARSGQASPAPGPWPRRGKWSRHYVGSRTKNCWTEPGQHRNYRLSSRHIFSSFHSWDSTLGATQLLFFIRPCLLCAGLRIKFREKENYKAKVTIRQYQPWPDTIRNGAWADSRQRPEQERGANSAKRDELLRPRSYLWFWQLSDPLLESDTARA